MVKRAHAGVVFNLRPYPCRESEMARDFVVNFEIVRENRLRFG
jgi:hypothetical protein